MAKKTPRTKTTARKSTRGKNASSSKKKASTTQRREPTTTSPDPETTVGETEITIDRRRRSGRRAEDFASAIAEGPLPPLERRQKVNRRRQIDPTTCERDYSDDEIEFMNALDEYKRKHGRMFPTCSEVLEVIRDLGYVKPGSTTAEPRPVQHEPAELQSIGA